MYTLHMCLKGAGTEMAASHDLDLYYIDLNYVLQNHFTVLKKHIICINWIGCTSNFCTDVICA